MAAFSTFRALAWRLLALVATLALVSCKDTYAFRDANAGFAVDFPGTDAPKDLTRTQDGIEIHSRGVEEQPGRFYRVTWTDLPPSSAGSPKDIYDGKRTDLTRGHGAIEHENDVRFGNVLGREFIYRASNDNADIHGTMRLFLNGQRLYQVHFFATTTAMVDSMTLERGKRFLDSFQIIKP
jgi:hypothetical protein